MPALDSSAPALSKQGAIELVSSLTRRLGTRLVPYLLLLVVPLMGRMSDPVVDVRQPASATFAAVVALLPLAQVCIHTHHASTYAHTHISCHVGPAALCCCGGPAAACSGMHISCPETPAALSCCGSDLAHDKPGTAKVDNKLIGVLTCLLVSNPLLLRFWTLTTEDDML